MRLSLDMLRTRHREDILLDACLRAKQPFVIDNTNPTRAERQKYISAAKAHRFRVICYHFETELEPALERNRLRPGKENIPEVGVRSTHKKFEIPSMDEGFDEIYTTRLEDGGFAITPNPIT